MRRRLKRQGPGASTVAALPAAALSQVQEDYLAAQLQRLDAEISVSHEHYGPPGGVERRRTPRPEPIRPPVFPASVAQLAHQPNMAVTLLDRARRALRKELRSRQARSPGV